MDTKKAPERVRPRASERGVYASHGMPSSSPSPCMIRSFISAS